MIGDREALIAAIAANPDEDTPRLVLADWLQENGEEDRAEFIRYQCEAWRLEESDPRTIELRDLAYDLFALRWPYWIESVCRALGAEETSLEKQEQTVSKRAVQQVFGERRQARYCLNEFTSDGAGLECRGNGPIQELRFQRGCVNHLNLSLKSPYLVHDIAAAFRSEPIVNLNLNCGSNPAPWKAINTSSLRQVTRLTLQVSSDHKPKAAVTFGAMIHGENWSRLQALALWSPGAEQLVVPDVYLDLLLHSPILAAVGSLLIAVHLPGLERLAQNPMCRHLRSLHIWGNHLPPEAGSVLENAVFRNNLECLYLALNDLGDEGVRSLMSNGPWTRLHSLDLGFNEITDSGVQYLLPLVPQLEELFLSGNTITDSGARVLADAIDSDKLVLMCLSYNPLSSEMVQLLRDRFSKRFMFQSDNENLAQNP